MFYYKFFCQTIQCPKKEGGHNVPPSDVSPTKKHADVTRVKMCLAMFEHALGYWKPEVVHSFSIFSLDVSYTIR